MKRMDKNEDDDNDSERDEEKKKRKQLYWREMTVCNCLGSLHKQTMSDSKTRKAPRRNCIRRWLRFLRYGMNKTQRNFAPVFIPFDSHFILFHHLSPLTVCDNRMLWINVFECFVSFSLHFSFHSPSSDRSILSVHSQLKAPWSLCIFFSRWRCTMDERRGKIILARTLRRCSTRQGNENAKGFTEQQLSIFYANYSTSRTKLKLRFCRKKVATEASTNWVSFFF